MLIKQIKASEVSDYEGKSCPKCHEGILKRELEHDAMTGNSTVLRCNRRNPCTYTIEIVSDRS